MKTFNCLSPQAPLFGPHLLEASAGTGKTFSIEHIFVRLILEKMEIEQILAVTFTRAAARELKARIRSNLEKALLSLEKKEAVWGYLEPFIGSQEALRQIGDAIAGFDRCQIFTIHGFCYRLLKEYSFEANIGSFNNPDEGRKIPEALRNACIDFLENGIDESLLAPEQITLLFKQFQSTKEIVDHLLRLNDVEPAPTFSMIVEQCKAALHTWKGPLVEEEKLLADFASLEKNYKAGIKGDFKVQVQALANLNSSKSIAVLLKEKGTVFAFLDPSRMKIRAKAPEFLHYPDYFTWAAEHIAPLLQTDVFAVLQNAWNPIAEKILLEEEHVDPDDILKKMQKAIEESNLAALVQKKYTAAIIDEFQDTDAVQWDIFQKLFLENKMRALYLVGDPKQSIYRFRKADVYTYLKARTVLGDENLYQLDTNFRSSKSLISALNALLNRSWHYLPKTKQILPYHPVKAGAEIKSAFSDEKGSVHFFAKEGEPSALFDTVFLPYVVNEIQKLALKNCAILVKDRYQIQKALQLLKAHNIPCVAKSLGALGKSAAFQAISELFDAVLFPRDKNRTKIVQAGPFGHRDIPFIHLKTVLEERGLVYFARHFSLDSDAMQIFEMLFEWEKNEGFSFEGLKRYMEELRELDPEEGGRRRMEVDEEAVQIMTLHISKGLEFDVVFALGLVSRTPESKEIEELEAEKQRQLYVAITRAKTRLYIPLALSKKEPELGTHSPIELFSRHFEGPMIDALEKLALDESITIEKITDPIYLTPSPKKIIDGAAKSSSSTRVTTPFYLNSFTTLAKTKGAEAKRIELDPNVFTIQTMPLGSETGIIIHALFEKIFDPKARIWQSSSSIKALILEELKGSHLWNWRESIEQMVFTTITMPIVDSDFQLSTLEPDALQVEMEFIYAGAPHFTKGFIDLVFQYKGRVYLMDWKTNWLESYDKESIQNEMWTHDYYLQASIYAKAVQLHFKQAFGGAFYLFVRGGAYTKWEEN